MSIAMFEFIVYPDGAEPFRLSVDSRDVVVWEDMGKGHAISQVQENPRFSDLYQIAHIAARRQQLFTGSLEEFKTTCVLDFGGDDGPDPTQSGHSPD